MKNISQPIGRDRQVLRKTILRYSLASYLTALAVVVIVLAVWWSLLQRILHFGQTRDYTVFDSLGPEVLGWVQKYNPFFWWGLVIICSIFIVYFLYVFVASVCRRTQQRAISAKQLEHLCHTLTPASTEVLAWVWDNRREPVTVGTLQRTVQSLSRGRYQQIMLCQEHERLLAKAQPQDDKPQNKEVLHTI